MCTNKCYIGLLVKGLMSLSCSIPETKMLKNSILLSYRPSWTSDAHKLHLGITRDSGTKIYADKKYELYKSLGNLNN